MVVYPTGISCDRWLGLAAQRWPQRNWRIKWFVGMIHINIEFGANQMMLITVGFALYGSKRGVPERTVIMVMNCYVCFKPTAWGNEKLILAYCFEHHPNIGVDEEAARKWRLQSKGAGHIGGKNKGGIKVVRNDKNMGRN